MFFDEVQNMYLGPMQAKCPLFCSLGSGSIFPHLFVPWNPDEKTKVHDYVLNGFKKGKNY